VVVGWDYSHLIAFFLLTHCFSSLDYNNIVSIPAQASCLNTSASNVNTKSFAVHTILTFTFSTTTNSPTGPFLWLRRCTVAPIAQLQRQDMARA
jgi:hypothetical protein